MEKIIVSACLAGEKCNYRGRGRTNKIVSELVDSGIAIKVCPEVLGGLPIPRSKAAITVGDGYNVLDRKSKIITESGQDVTENYIKGAKITLETARKYGIKKAFLNNYSPSCGNGKIISGGFGKYKNGDGITTALLKRNNIEIISKKELERIYRDYKKAKNDTLTKWL